jgi:hypothetical protein
MGTIRKIFPHFNLSIHHTKRNHASHAIIIVVVRSGADYILFLPPGQVLLFLIFEFLSIIIHCMIMENVFDLVGRISFELLRKQ